MTTQINIQGKQHPFRYGYGALMLAEEILGKPWGELQNSRANFVLMYCCLLNADADFPYSFEQLIDECDADHALVHAMSEAMTAQIAKWGKPKADAEGDDKKKG